MRSAVTGQQFLRRVSRSSTSLIPISLQIGDGEQQMLGRNVLVFECVRFLE